MTFFISVISKTTQCYNISGIYSMRYVRHIVLDEADTLMDDSFNEQMTKFLSRFHV